MKNSIILFGDTYGIPQALRYLPGDLLKAMVAASIRPHQHEDLAALAAQRSVPLLLQPRRDSPGYAEFVRTLTAVNPDLVFVNSYSMKLHPEILACAPVAVNVHSALLPRNRGANPTQWAIINGETETGVTMHHMTDEMDAGDIIAQRRVPIRFEDTWVQVQQRIAAAAEEMLSREVPNVLRGTTWRASQDASRATRNRRRKPEDALFSWSEPVVHIYNMIRAVVHPLPGAFYETHDARIVIGEYRSIPEVTAMKYDETIGGQRLQGDLVSLSPVSDKECLREIAVDIPMLHTLINECDRAVGTNNTVLFGIRLCEQRVLSGLCLLSKIDWTSREAELRLWLDPLSGTDPAVASDVRNLALRFAFRELQLNAVSDYVHNGKSPTVTRPQLAEEPVTGACDASRP